MRSWVKPNMFLGGDWNCVPDVTLDVQSKDPLRYKNVGGELLEEVMASAELHDFRRTQLVNEPEPTRMPYGAVSTKQGKDWVATRLDRFYIPLNEEHEDLLPSFGCTCDGTSCGKRKPEIMRRS